MPIEQQSISYGENPTGASPPNNTALTGATYGYNGAQGKLTDTASGITLMGDRPYQASTGRFIQPDPKSGGCANLYTHGFGDPINYPDLSGRLVQSPGGGGPPCTPDWINVENIPESGDQTISVPYGGDIGIRIHDETGVIGEYTVTETYPDTNEIHGFEAFWSPIPGLANLLGLSPVSVTLQEL